MKSSVFLLLLISLFINPVFSQDDSLKYQNKDLLPIKYYPLPPGPSTISGTLVDQHGNPIKGAKVTVKYPDGKQRSVDTFTSNEEGIFQVYIFRDKQPYIDLEIMVGKKVCKTIRYDNPGLGMNMGHYTQKISCKVKSKKLKDKKRSKTK